MTAGRDAINSTNFLVPIPGFSQAVSAPHGRLLFVSGLTARAADGSIAHVGDLAKQTRVVLENIRSTLAAAGATADDVVQLRAYFVDISRWPEIEPVWKEFWGDVWPALTAVQVARLSDERQLIEVEALAVIPDPSTRQGQA